MSTQLKTCCNILDLLINWDHLRKFHQFGGRESKRLLDKTIYCWDMLGYILLVVTLTKLAKNTKYSKKQNSTFGPFLGSLYISSSLFPLRNGTATVYPRAGRPVVGSYYRPRPLRCVHPWLKGGGRLLAPTVTCGKPTRMAMEQTQTYHVYIIIYTNNYINYIYNIYTNTYILYFFRILKLWP